MHLLVLAFLFLGGLFAGSYASVVGGGGLLSFPLLVFAGLPTHQAIATQRFSAVILELFSALRFHKEKALDVKKIIPLSIYAMIGAAIGATISLHLDAKILNLVVSPLIVGALILILNRKHFVATEHAGSKPSIWLGPSMLLLGIYGGFFGAGFGFFVIVALSLFGYSFIESAAMGRAVGFCMSLVAMLVFAKSGVINYHYGLAIGSGFAIGSWVGIGIAIKKGEPYIKGLLVIVAVLTVVKLLWDVFG